METTSVSAREGFRESIIPRKDRVCLPVRSQLHQVVFRGTVSFLCFDMIMDFFERACAKPGSTLTLLES